MRARLGRIKNVGFLRLALVSKHVLVYGGSGTHSLADTGRGESMSAVGKGNCDGVGRSHGESMSSSVEGVASGVGEASGNARSLDRKLKGALCGRGEMSIESGWQQGEDEGIGGVVTPSQRMGGVVVPSAAGAQYPALVVVPLFICSLTPIVQLLEQAGGEKRPSRCGELRTEAFLATRTNADM